MAKGEILIVEDDRIVAEDIRRHLVGIGFDVSGIVSSGEEAIGIVKDKQPDLILMDIILMGEIDGIDTAGQIRTNFDIPVVYLTANTNEDILERAKVTEPFGYIIKPFQDSELTSTIEIALYKHRMENKVKEKSHLNQILMDALPCIAMLLRANYEIVISNEAAIEVGAVPGERCFSGWYNRDKPCPWCMAKKALGTMKAQHLEVEDSVIIWDTYWIPISSDLFLHYASDITEKRKMNAQYKQARKMEVLGTLAGGIAHDFNNILSSIIGNTEMALYDELPEDTPAKFSLEEVLKGAYRARKVIKQVSVFRRKDDYEKEPLDLPMVVKATLDLLSLSIPENIELVQDITAGSGMILGNHSQIYQILIYIGNNAFDAMRLKGGLLKVSVSEVEFPTTDSSRHPDLKPGFYMKLTISDTGEGIDEANIDRIYDPYFTTKIKKDGTGLGLYTVYDIVKSGGGSISVESQIGKGTEFNILLPKVVPQLSGN